MNTFAAFIAIIAMIGCLVALTKPWGYEKSIQDKTLESSKEDTKEC